MVMYDDNYALIDKTGREILPAIYESLDWDCHNGIAKVMLDGLYGLYGRDGQELVAPCYEWMGETEDELIPIREAGRWGYIRRDGTVVIAPRFEDASSFDRGGYAEVVDNGVRRRIDTSGTFVDDKVGTAK